MKNRPEIKTTKPLNAVVPASSPIAVGTVDNKEVFYQNAQNALGYFTADNAPASYSELKKEVKVLVKIHAQSFLILSHRLKIIKDNELYKEDGYNDFKAFIENELDLARAMVYGYIRVLETFGVYPEIHDNNLKITSLMRVASIAQDRPEDARLLFSKANEMSRRDLENWLKERYGSERTKKLKEENLTDNNWYESEEELVSNSKVIRDGMKKNTIKRDARDYINWLLIDDPKNKALQKMKDLWTDL